MWHLRQAADPRAQEQGRGLGLLPGPSYPLGQDREAAKDEICRAYGSPVDQRQRNSLDKAAFARRHVHTKVVHPLILVQGFLGTSFQKPTTESVSPTVPLLPPPTTADSTRPNKMRRTTLYSLLLCALPLCAAGMQIVS